MLRPHLAVSIASLVLLLLHPASAAEGHDTVPAAAAGHPLSFTTSTTTPLYSSHWSPHTTGSYAGACIFLLVLAVFFRSLFALKRLLEVRWLDAAVSRRYVVVAGQTPESERMARDPDAKSATLTTNGVEESVKVVHRPAKVVQPWRFSVDLPRAALTTVIVGVGYMLMLAIMTFNVGYFLSVLAGTFLGEVALGRYTQAVHENH